MRLNSRALPSTLLPLMIAVISGTKPANFPGKFLCLLTIRPYLALPLGQETREPHPFSAWGEAVGAQGRRKQEKSLCFYRESRQWVGPAFWARGTCAAAGVLCLEGPILGLVPCGHHLGVL